MKSRETAGATEPSLAQEWLNAVRYWLRGRNGVIALIVLAVVIGAALNWSWLVAVGIAPLLVTVLPCAAMCALGLCMNRIAGRSCSSETRTVEMPKADARAAASSESGGQGPAPLLADTPTPPHEPVVDTAIDAGAPARPEERS
jgi:hypothetical protein